MKLKIGEKLINPKDEPFAIIFENAEEVKEFSEYIWESAEMNPKMRVYVCGPDNIDLKEFVKDYLLV